MSTLATLLLAACFDYELSSDPPAPGLDLIGPGLVEPPHPQPRPSIGVEPAHHDFGAAEPWDLVTQMITVTNIGFVPLTVTGLGYDADSVELAFDADTATNGPLPWTLAPGESRDVWVSYLPVDDAPDRGTLTVESDDPRRPSVPADQVGTALFQGFATGWYIVNDDTPYDLTSDRTHRVDYDGDPDAYWYEPSGYHGMTDSTDVPGDFAALRDYVIARAGGPTPVTGPLSFYAASDLPDMEQGSFSYLLCDFWMDEGEDPTRYTLSTGRVDDGVRVILNGSIVGELTYGQKGNWTLTDAVPGQVNTLLVILMDNAMWEKYIYDLAFYKDGVMVSG